MFQDFPGGSAGQESACNVGDLGLISGLRRSPGEGKGFSLLDLFLQIFPSSFLIYCHLSFSQVPVLFWVLKVAVESESHSVMSDSL